MKSEDVKNSRDATRAVRYLLEKLEEGSALIASLQSRLKEVEDKQGFLARRPKIAIPPFPHILTMYHIYPPEERPSR